MIESITEKTEQTLQTYQYKDCLSYKFMLNPFNV
jgi:hypothetical protein